MAVVINEFELKGDEGLTRHLRADRAALAALRWFARGTALPASQL